MTHRLYYSDSYIRDFEALITDRSDDGRRVYLDRTAFYPTSGGQPFDTGHLGNVEVEDVVDEGERIAHLLAAPVAGQRVSGQIDWARRFDHMQQHTGQHLLSAILAEELGRKTVAVHFGKESSTVDLEGDTISAPQVVLIEERANEVVTQNRPVEVSFENASTVTGLRKPSERDGSLRIVTIDGLDRSACGGTHVRATGEIGSILIRKVERARTGIRLEFLCGRRAVQQSRADYQLLSTLAAEFTAAPAELPRLVHGIRTELRESRAASQTLQAEANLARAHELYAATMPDSDGVRRILRQESSGPLDRLKGLGQAISSMPKTMFVGATCDPHALILACSKDSGIDAGKTLKQCLSANGGRGGGSSALAQGVLPGPAQLERAIVWLMKSGREG